MRRFTRGRAATDDEGTPQGSAASEPVSAAPDDAQQGGSGVPANGSVATAGSPDEQRTAVLPAAVEGRGGEAGTKAGEAGAEAGESGAAASGTGDAGDATKAQPGEPRGRDLPAGVDPDKLDSAPTSASRSRLRRRVRYLSAVREVLLRDIGGFYYEAQRTDEGPEAHRRLLDSKAARLGRLDEELRELRARLEEERPQTTMLRQPGLGGTCPQCGELHGSDARFCSRCGTPLGKRPNAPRPASASTGASTSSGEPKATTASLWGRPKRPDPATSDPTVAGPGATVASEPASRAGALFAGGGPKAAASGDANGVVERDEAAAGREAAGTDEPAAGGEAAGGDEAATRDDSAKGSGGEPAPTGSERS